MIRLGVPAKGRLMDATFAWFRARGVRLGRTTASRAYAGTVEGTEGVSLVLSNAGEIPRELAAGRLHLGVTGQDVLREQLPLWRQQVREVALLGYGHADLVVAVPECWVDVDTLDDLDAVAGDFRAAHGMRLRIATKYHRLSRDFLRRHDMADYQLVDSQGATEGTIRNHRAEAVVDITSSGQTLRANQLKILQDGVILRSQATLFQSCSAPLSTAAQATLDRLMALID